MTSRRAYLKAMLGAALLPASTMAQDQPVPLTKYGAKLNGFADDTAAVQEAVNDLAGTGGTILVSGPCRLTKQVTVRSRQPVNFLAYGGGHLHSQTQRPPGFILGADIDGAMIRYETPGPRGAHGGGRISGLAFYDPTATGGLPGTFRCFAALDLRDFGLSTVEDCTFQWINGSAIYGEFVVMSSIRNNRIRYCGAPRRPAVRLEGADLYAPQSLDFAFNRLEVCHGDSYLALGPRSADCKMVGNGFEAETSIASSNQEFLTLAGNAHHVLANHFNRNAGSQATIAAQGSTLVGNSFRGGPSPVTALTISGDRNRVSDNQFASIRTGLEVDITGASNAFAGNTLYASGAIRVTGAKCRVSDNTLDGCTATREALGADTWWLVERSSGAIVSGNQFTHLSRFGKTVGGVLLQGKSPMVHDNTFDGFDGPANAGVCIRVEARDPSIGTNKQTNSTKLLSAPGDEALRRKR